MHPPRWAEWILTHILPPHDRDAISGDLLEEYRERFPLIAYDRRLRAEWWYVKQTVSLLWPLMWPCLMFIGMATIASMLLLGEFGLHIVGLHTFGPVEGGIVLVGVWAGVRGGQRARNLQAGPLVAAATALVACYTLTAAGIAVELIAEKSYASMTLGPFGPTYVGPWITAVLASGSGYLGGLLGCYLGSYRLSLVKVG